MTVARVPYPVDEEVRDVEESKEAAVPAVGGGVVVSEVDGTVAVSEGNAGQIPEDEHPAPFLVVHIPKTISSALVSNHVFRHGRRRKRMRTRSSRYFPQPSNKHSHRGNAPSTETAPLH